MTTYGTIPTAVASGSSSNQERFFSRAKDRIGTGLGARRPWKEMVSLRMISLPRRASDAVARFRTNAAYFRVNYAIIVLFVLFLSLLWHPISLIVFVAMMSAWLFLYFLRDEPIAIFRRAIDDRVVLLCLSVVTIALLFLTRATVNIAVGLAVGAAAAAVHGVLRRTDDLLLDEEEGGIESRAAWRRVPLKETASSSFSSSP